MLTAKSYCQYFKNISGNDYKYKNIVPTKKHDVRNVASAKQMMSKILNQLS